jgi:hypothetical protein
MALFNSFIKMFPIPPYAVSIGGLNAGSEMIAARRGEALKIDAGYDRLISLWQSISPLFFLTSGYQALSGRDPRCGVWIVHQRFAGGGTPTAISE